MEKLSNRAEAILVTGTRMGHVKGASFPAVQGSYFSSIAPDVPVENIGKAWTTSTEIRRYFKHLRKHRGESRSILVIGYGWEYPRKGKEEEQFKRDRRQNKGEPTPVYPSLPPSAMSRAVDSVAVDVYRSEAEESTKGEKGGTIVFLKPSEERIRIIVDSVSKKRKNKGIKINYVQAEPHLADGPLPKVPAEGESQAHATEDFSRIEQTKNYQQLAAYEVDARDLQRKAERWHVMPLIDYLFRFKKPNMDAGVK